jgi:hypothetical protein
MDLFTDVDWRTASITRALVIREPWAGMIASGAKRWELRSRTTSVRGPIAIAAAGTLTIVAVCTLVEVSGPLSPRDYSEGWRQRGAGGPSDDPMPYASTFAWVLAAGRPLAGPVRYRHPRGAVIWVKLDQDVQDRIRQALGANVPTVKTGS